MAFKSEIRKAITNNSPFVAIKVWKPEYTENFAGEGSLTIEVNVRKKTRKERKQSKVVPERLAWTRDQIIKFGQDCMVIGVKSQREKFDMNEAFLDHVIKSNL